MKWAFIFTQCASQRTQAVVDVVIYVYISQSRAVRQHGRG